MAQNFVFNLFSTAAVASVFLLLLLELTETTRDVKKVREKGRAGAHFFVTKAGARAFHVNHCTLGGSVCQPIDSTTDYYLVGCS